MKKAWHRHFPRSHKGRRTRGEKTFSSLAETRRYDQLVILERAGEIRNLRTHVGFPLESPSGAHVVKTPKGGTAKYTADFVYEERVRKPFVNLRDFDEWREVIEDVKGFTDRIAELRIAVFEALTFKTVTIVKMK